MYLKVGRFGPYVQRGTPDDEEKPQNASLLKGMTPDDVDLATALKLLSLPRKLGDHPQQAQPIMAYNGRFGPYVKCGERNALAAGRSLAARRHARTGGRTAGPAQSARPRRAPPPSTSRSRSSTTRRSPARTVQLLDGRYGPYVTDGETNASLPKGSNPEELTFSEALDLLAERAAAGPSKKAPKKKRRRRRRLRKRRQKRRRRRKNRELGLQLSSALPLFFWTMSRSRSFGFSAAMSVKSTLLASRRKLNHLA